jgi:hypothetical protein
MSVPKIKKKTADDLNTDIYLFCESKDPNGVCGKTNAGECENSLVCGDREPVTLNVGGCVA